MCSHYASPTFSESQRGWSGAVLETSASTSLARLRMTTECPANPEEGLTWRDRLEGPPVPGGGVRAIANLKESIAPLRSLLLALALSSAHARQQGVRMLYRGATSPAIRPAFGTLPNGLRYAVRRNDWRRAVSIRAVESARSTRRMRRRAGALIEHMMFRGTASFADARRAHLQRLGHFGSTQCHDRATQPLQDRLPRSDRDIDRHQPPSSFGMRRPALFDSPGGAERA